MAMRNFNMAINFSPKDSEAYKGRGEVYFELGDYDAAIADFSKALELEPTDYEVYDKRGTCYQKLGMIMSAEADLKKNPKPVYPSYMQRGDDCYESEKFTEAIEYYNKAIEIKTDNNYKLATAYFRRGVAYFELKTMSNRLKILTKVSIQAFISNTTLKDGAMRFMKLGKNLGKLLTNILIWLHLSLITPTPLIVEGFL